MRWSYRFFTNWSYLLTRPFWIFVLVFVARLFFAVAVDFDVCFFATYAGFVCFAARARFTVTVSDRFALTIFVPRAVLLLPAAIFDRFFPNVDLFVLSTRADRLIRVCA